MAASVTVGNGGNKLVTSIHANTGSGNVEITEGWIGTAGGSKQFFFDLGVSVSPVSASAPENGTKTTPNNVATGAFGAGGYSYLWSYVSGLATIMISSTTSNIVHWTVASPGNKTAKWKVTVTDAHGKTAFAIVDVEFTDNQ